MTDGARILAVNPNTSREVTEAYLREVRRIAPPGLAIDGVTGTFGARIVSTEAENTIAGHALLELIARHGAGYDAIILAISFDTAYRAARELLPIPVVGITEAALLAATAHAQSIGVVLFGRTSLPMYRRVIEGYGIAPVAYETIEIASATDYLTPADKDREAVSACQRLASAGAGAVVICGTVVVGMATRLKERAGIPLYDGATALDLCLDRIRATATAPAPPRPLGEITGLSEELAALLRGTGRETEP